MDTCSVCCNPADQLFETGTENVFACFKCQPLVPEVTLGHDTQQEIECEQNDQEEDDDEPGRELKCPLCHKIFQKNMQLQNHIRNHKAERKFVCTYCNKAFSQSNNLRAHLRIHTNERPYKCSECGKAFTQVTNLNNHVRLHTGERPFVCTEPGCDKAYAQVTNLNQHRKRHFNGRPMESSYSCTICGEQFSQRNHMYMHRRDAHSELGLGSQSVHQCKVCDDTFTSERQLMAHVADHVNDNTDKKDEAPRPVKCVFSSCGLEFDTPAAHTDHLVQTHQIRILTPASHNSAKRGRPPKSQRKEATSEHNPSINFVSSQPKEATSEHHPSITFVSVDTILKEKSHFFPKLRVQSLFQ